MEKKKKRAPERKLTRTTIIALVVIVLASLAHIALLWLTPNRPDYYDGNIIYPVMKHWQMIDLGIFVTVIGAYFAVGRLIPPRQLGCGLWLLMLVFNCMGVIIVSLAIDYSQWSLRHNDSIRFNNKVYHLETASGDVELDYTSASHIVYECDSLGIICKNIAQPASHPKSGYFYREIISVSPTEFTLSQDKSELYVIIGEEEFLVATQEEK